MGFVGSKLDSKYYKYVVSGLFSFLLTFLYSAWSLCCAAPCAHFKLHLSQTARTVAPPGRASLVDW